MSGRRTFQPKIDDMTLLASLPKYNIKRAVALYGRHSGKKQFGNIATTQQTEGQRKLALKLGWTEDLHRTFYEDLKGISAYKVPMDMRKSYSELYNSIVKGEIGTVMCYLVDRLFRTKNGEEWELFINACVRSNVKVITTAPPMRVYDLSVSSDADDFRQKCIEARRYVEEIVKKRLNAARDELGYAGLWTGAGVPVGFYVDLDDTSETFKKFLIYEPHAKLIRAIFKRYRELSGAFNSLAREIEARQPFFPLFEELEKLPNIALDMNEAKTGYVLGRNGLVSILTNPMYIGLYTYKGLKMYSNHDVIVDKETFFYAFNRLSKYDLDGNEKETERTRAQGYETLEKIDALLRGKITSSDFTHFSVSSANRTYAFEKLSNNFHVDAMQVPVSMLDSTVSEKLVSRLSKWDEYLQHMQRSNTMKQMRDTLVDKVNQSVQTMLDTVKIIAQEPVTTIASVDDQIPQIEARIKTLRRNLDLDADKETLNGWAKELKEKSQELARLKAKQKAIAASQESKEEAKDLLLRVPDEWGKMDFENRQRAINLMIESISVVESSPHFLTMTIAWKLPFVNEETFYIWRLDGTQQEWTDEEKTIVREHYPQTPVQEILELLPSRSWRSIQTRASAMHLYRSYRTLWQFSRNLSMNDIHFMHKHGIDESTFDASRDVAIFESRDVNNISMLYS